VLKLNDVTVRYGQFTALDGVTVRVGQGVTLILGPNGAGKTTLLKAVSGIVRYEGSVKISGKEVRNLSLALKGKYVSYVPPTVTAMPEMNIGDLILTDYSINHDLLEKYVQILELKHLLSRRLWEVSSGELARALLARGLARGSTVIAVDEPLSHIDIKHQLRLLKELRALGRTGKVVLIASNQLNPALTYSDYVLALKGGKAVFFGSVKEFLETDILSSIYGVKVKVVTEDGLIDVIPIDVA